MDSVRYVVHRVFLQQPYVVVGLPLEVPTGVPRRLKGAAFDRPFWVQEDGVATVFRIGEVGGLAGWYGVNVWWSFEDGDFPDFSEGPIASGAKTVALGDPVGSFPLHGANGDLWPIFLEFRQPVLTYQWTARARRAAPGAPAMPVTVETVTLQLAPRPLSDG